MWLFFFFKQKTAYEMRISDWSSDVCSSDLAERVGQNQHEQHEQRHADDILAAAQRRAEQVSPDDIDGDHRGHGEYEDERADEERASGEPEIGRAACRERGRRYA